MRSVEQLVADFTHLFFPHICAGCGSDLISDEVPVCMRCVHELPVTNFSNYAANPVEKYFWGRIEIVAASAFCHFTTGSLIQHLLHRLKYHGDQQTGRFLGMLMGQSLQTAERFKNIDLLIPVPLFASREKQRGYNQSAVLCEGMATVLNIPVLTHALQRVVATETQTRKNRINRWGNMQGRFSLSEPDLITGKHVLLVDDVITTGATLEACGQELLLRPGVQLSIATLAYTV